MNNFMIYLVVLPLAAAFVCQLGRYFPRCRVAEAASLGAIAACLALLALNFPAVFERNALMYAIGGWAEPMGISFYMDGFAWMTSLMVMMITLFAVVFSLGEGNYNANFYFFFLLMLAGMEGVILTGDIFNMFVFIEIMSIASYILVAYPGKGGSILASFNYFILSSLGIGFYLLGVFVLYQLTGTLSLRALADLVGSAHKGSAQLNLAVASLIVGIGLRAAIVPLHTWLPDAHAFAPHPVSAVLSGVMIKVSFLAMWRVMRFLQADELQHLLLWVGVFTALLGVVGAIVQTESKKLLAYSSISQMGNIVAAFGAATPLSDSASFYHLLNHALFKSLLFLSIGSVMYSTGEKDVRKLGNLGGRMPLVCITFLVGALSISGIPPFNGYASKSLISHSLNEHPLAYGLILLSYVGTVASFIKLSRIFIISGMQAGPVAVPRRKARGMMLFPLVALSLLCAATGAAPRFWTNAIHAILTGEEAALDPSFYTYSHTLSTAATVCLGFFLYYFLQSRVGKKSTAYLLGIRLSLNNSLILVVAGFLFFTIAGWMIGR